MGEPPILGFFPTCKSRPPRRIFGRCRALIVLVASAAIATTPAIAGETWDRIRAEGRLVYGCDMEGGGPYAYIDPDDTARIIGFEVEFMDALAERLGVEADLSQGQWDQLLNVLDAENVDVVVNGYELTPHRARDYLASRPYYLFELQLMVAEGSPVASWTDLMTAKPGGDRWRVGVLGRLECPRRSPMKSRGARSRSRAYTGATDAMMQVLSGQLDATLQDLPAARFYGPRFEGLRSVGAPVGGGYYVVYLRKGDAELARVINRAIGELIADGTLDRINRKYDVWTEAQVELAELDPDRLAEEVASRGREGERGAPLIWKYRGRLLRAAGRTVLLSVISMPIAIFIGLLIALGRLYGPAIIKVPLAVYVELIRGTPLMLQLFVLFYLANLPPYVAGIAGLAINYSAYEAEIYRAGLQAIPAGQMEAALALGMSRRLALRRVIVPQAIRIVIPPVTNDFIALFKDSSVCSVITLVELSKQYQILANGTGGVLEFAFACALLYLLMSLPLSWLSRWSERRLKGLSSRASGGGATT